MKKTILLIVFTLFTYGCESKKSSVDKSNISESTSIAGTYVDNRDGWTYILKSNGTFIHKTSMGTDRGTYKQNGNNIVFYQQGIETGSGHYHGTTSSQLVDFYEEYKIEIEHILEEGIDAGEFRDMNKEGVSTMLMAFLDGLGLQIIIMKNPKVFHKIKSEAIESFMRGILK